MTVMLSALLAALINAPACPVPEGVLPADRCPAVFGDEADREALAEAHEVVRSVHEGEYAIDIVHTSRFDEPARVALDAAHVVGVERTDECGLVALVELDLPEVCEPGVYAVPRDVFLGELQVVAVVPSGLLLLDGAELWFVRREDAPPPVFRMTWASSWRLPPARRPLSPARPSKPPPPMRRR